MAMPKGWPLKLRSTMEKKKSSTRTHTKPVRDSVPEADLQRGKLHEDNIFNLCQGIPRFTSRLKY